MSFSLRFTEREGTAGNFPTRKNSLPPWSSIGELKVINTVALRYSRTKPSFIVKVMGSWVEPRDNTRSSLLGGMDVCFYFSKK